MAELQAIKRRFGIIGNDEKLNQALNTALRVSSTDLSVLIQGESGVGKEVFSKIIHQLSPRKHNQFIAINTGAIPEGTINSELFGHEKGAFTGATSDRKGYFETANGGTIFLDEIGEMPPDTQAFLLRILESGEYIRVGSSAVRKTDVRVIAATNVNLQRNIEQGKFREDLYYRLNTVPIKVPSLAERREDIYPLYRKFAQDFAGKYSSQPIELDEGARLLFENYSWPGNIRELKNVVEQLSILSDNPNINMEQLIKLVPDITQRNLPKVKTNIDEDHSFQEREILYKLLFEMRSDLQDLKSLIFELIRKNNLSIPEIDSMKLLTSGNATTVPPQYFNQDTSYSNHHPDKYRGNQLPPRYYDGDDGYSNEETMPIILNDHNNYSETETVEERLSLEDMEKELIKKALERYKGRRRDAAEELGISERTLYRKIKQYDL